MTVWAAAVILAAPQTMGADEDIRNQLASMEYKQWKFTPESYYYSWYMKKIDLGLFTIKTKVPGLGMHDHGPGGVGGADNYVNEEWRQMTRLRAIAAAEGLLQKGDTKDEMEQWEDIAAKDAVQYADKTLDLPYVGAWSVTRNERDRHIERIYENIRKIPADSYELAVRFNEELRKLEEEASCIHNAVMENARKIDALNNLNFRYGELADKVENVVNLQRYTDSEWVKNIVTLYK